MKSIKWFLTSFWAISGKKNSVFSANPFLIRITEKEINFDTDTEFEFSFDIGLYPEFTSSVSDQR
jgi:hypothetical protein